MTRYETRRVPAYDGFEVDGHVVAVLTTHTNTVDVLVEIPEASTEGVALYAVGEEDSVGTVPDEEGPTCSGTKSNDEPCTRDVDEPGDYCWQHEDQEDEE